MSERIVTGLLAGLAVLWCGASFFLRGDGVPDWWLPLALAAGVAGTLRLVAPEPMPGADAPRTMRMATWLVIAIAGAALAYGAVATPSRHWDGAASFDAKFRWLAESPTLLQPFFAERGVFHHSPDYPLLQPLLCAMVERLVPGLGKLALVGIWLLTLAVTSTALRRRGVAPGIRLAVVLAIALTPALLAPGGGAIDSGYHEVSLLLATTTMAAGFLTDRARFVALGAMLAILVKPEGLPYAILALAVGFARGEPRFLWPTFAGIALALLTWEPVQQVLLHRAAFQQRPMIASDPALAKLFEPKLHYPVMLPMAALALLGLDRLFLMSRIGTRGRWRFVLLAPLVPFAMLPWIAPIFAGEQGALSLYLQRGASVYTGFANLPAWAAAFADYGVMRLRLGMALVLPAACLFVAWRRGVALRDADLGRLLLLGLAVSALPFMLTIEADLHHHLRSSLPRLLMHWVGPAWLLSASWLDALARRAPA